MTEKAMSMSLTSTVSDRLAMSRSCVGWLNWLVRRVCRRRRESRLSRVVLWDGVVLLSLLGIERLVSLLGRLSSGDWVALERVWVSGRLLVLILRRRRTRRRGREVLLVQSALLVRSRL